MNEGIAKKYLMIDKMDAMMKEVYDIIAIVDDILEEIDA